MNLSSPLRSSNIIATSPPTGTPSQALHGSELPRHIRNEIILQILQAGGIDKTSYIALKYRYEPFYNNLTYTVRKKISDKFTYWKKFPERFRFDCKRSAEASDEASSRSRNSSVSKMSFNSSNRDYYLQFLPIGFDVNRIEFYHVDFSSYEYGGLVVNEIKEILCDGRICESAFQITVDAEYIDQSRYMSRLLPSNEVLVLLPSVSNLLLDNSCYKQGNDAWNILNSSDGWQPHFVTSQNVMRSACTSIGKEHLKVRAIILTFPDDYKVSNELFSPSTHLGFDPRTKVHVAPCTVQYTHEEKQVNCTFFRLCWRYSKAMENPRTTNVGASHVDTAFTNLNQAFARQSLYSSTPRNPLHNSVPPASNVVPNSNTIFHAGQSLYRGTVPDPLYNSGTVVPPASNVAPNSNTIHHVPPTVVPTVPSSHTTTVQSFHVASTATVPPLVQPSTFPKSPPITPTAIVPYTVTSNGSSPGSAMSSSLDTYIGNPQPQLSFMQQVLQVIAPRDDLDGGAEDMDIDNLKRKREKDQRKKSKTAKNSALVKRTYNTRSSAKLEDSINDIAFKLPDEEIDVVDLGE